VTIAGNLKDIFRGILGVGRDINPNSATRCGSVWINRMTIAGNDHVD
jgi:PmbA protein